jgi:ketosteroid isomerase-like protein
MGITLRSVNSRLDTMRKFTAFVLVLVLVLLAVACSSSRTSSAETFLSFLDRMDAAQLELQRGDAAAYKKLWAHDGDVTISGGFGGTIEKGWPAVERRVDWAATQFTQGANTIERVSVGEGRDLAYVVQTERIRFVIPGENTEATRVYRTTMVFRRTPDGWRIIHRHADSQTTQQPVKR